MAKKAKADAKRKRRDERKLMPEGEAQPAISHLDLANADLDATDSDRDATASNPDAKTSDQDSTASVEL